ncbi:Translation initiation factor IF-2, partial [Bienertia sinuspersici]
KIKHQRLREFATRNQRLILQPYTSFPVANRTRAQLREHARQIPLPLSDSSSPEGESEENFEMANPASTLLELAAPRFNPDLLCITYDDDEAELQPRPPQIQQPQQPQSGGMSLEEIVKSMASSTLQFQQETRSGLKNLENQVSQLANTPTREKPKGECKCHFFKKWKGIRRTAC